MMEHPGFFERAGPFALSDLASRLGAEIAAAHLERAAKLTLADVRPRDEATERRLAFIDNRKYLPQLAATRAAAVLVAPVLSSRVPASVIPLVIRNPYRAFAESLALFYPSSRWPTSSSHAAGEPAVHPSARIEDDVVVEPGAVIGREAWIGRGSRIAAGAVVGYRVTVGRDSYIGPGASIVHALIGNRVIVHAGVRIGQDGFGFAMGAGGHLKVPQIGRVILQDDVEIGANTTIDRGALKDTIIGEGTKIDNLCQIGHNVQIGRHCIIVAQVGIAGSSVLEDFVVMGGKSGVSGHLRVGVGAKIAGGSLTVDNVPAGARVVGVPAQPIKDWTRERAAIKRLTRGGEAASPEALPED